jgi:hypothetical protein
MADAIDWDVVSLSDVRETQDLRMKTHSKIHCKNTSSDEFLVECCIRIEGSFDED